MAIQRLLDDIRHPAAVGNRLAEPGHGLVGMLQGQRLGAGDAQALLPVMGVAIRTRDHQPVQHGQVDGTFDVEAETAFGQQAAQDIAAASFPPQPPEHQVRADAAPSQFGQLAAVEARQYDRAPGMAGGRGDQAIKQIRILDCIAATKRLNDALDVAPALTGVLDEVQVFVRPNPLDANEHGAEPGSSQGTTATRAESRYACLFTSRNQTVFAPQVSRPPSQARNSAPFWSPEAQRCGSWAKEVKVEGRRYIVCRNEAEAAKDAADRQAIVAALDQQLKRGDKALIGNSAYRRYLRTTSDRRAFEIDAGKLADEARYDGIFVLRTNARLTPLQAVLRYRDLIQVEQLFRSAKALMRTRPIYHASDAAIRGHVFCSFLALVLRKELDERCRNAGFRPEWGDVLRDLDRLQEVEIRKDDQHITLRTPATGVVGPLFKAARIALPQNLRGTVQA